MLHLIHMTSMSICLYLFTTAGKRQGIYLWRFNYTLKDKLRVDHVYIMVRIQNHIDFNEVVLKQRGLCMCTIFIQDPKIP